jgi:hypothetical protein
MARQPSDALTKSEEAYIRAIDGYRKFALSIPALCVSLSSALLAFEIYYLQYFYVPKDGLYAEDIIVMLPMFVGSMFLVAAALAVDWVIDSMSPAENRAFISMYPDGHVPHQEKAKGFVFRVTLFSGAYAIFCFCLALLLFLLVAAIPIFLKSDVINVVAREITLLAGAYYAILVLLKLLTTTLPRTFWSIALTALFCFVLGNVWSLLSLLKVVSAHGAT